MVTSGDVLAKGPWGSGQLGPGGVIGLAEGLCDQPLQESFQALGVVNAKLIPIDSAIRELQRIKPSLRDVATGKTLQTWRHDHYVYSVAFSPDGRQVLTGSFDDPPPIPLRIKLILTIPRARRPGPWPA